MQDPIFIPPDEVFNEIFNVKKLPKLSETEFWVIISFTILFVCIFLYVFRKDILRILFILGSAFYLTDVEKLKSLLDCLKKNAGIAFGPIVLGVILFYAMRDPQALTNYTSSYVLVIVAALALTFGMYSSLPDFSNMSYMPFLIGGIVLSIITFIVYFSSYITPRVITFIANVLRIMIVLMAIVGLAIGYKLFSEKLKLLTGWQGFFANFLFYIPCLLNDGLGYLLQQYNTTPIVVFILLIIELVLIMVYINIPKIMHKAIKAIKKITHNATQKKVIVLQNKPIYLDKEKNVGNVEKFVLPPIDPNIGGYNENLKRTLKRTYCINMWVFLNIQPSSNASYANETDIFNYNNHPRIAHKNVSSTNRSKNGNVYRFYFSNTKDGNSVSDTENTATYEVSIPDQKWNMLSFNYFETKVDVYINGNLEKTYYFTNNIPDYSSTDTILLGKDNGLHGVICNVSYDKVPLSSEQIATLYNMNYWNNPPVDILE